MTKNKTKLIMTIVSLCFILFFRFVPAPEGLTATGMQVIGVSLSALC